MRGRTVIALLCVSALAGCGGDKPRRATPPAAPATPTRAAAPQATPAPVAAKAVVLGEAGILAGAPGWGLAHPRSITVGGDPALVINDIRWRGWGRRVARGVGRAAAFTYRGGDTYRRQVRVELRAYELGRCRAAGPRAYRNLRLRMPPRPGAPMGQWFVLGAGAHGLCR